MPGGGLELLRRVRQRRPQARVLVFSMHDSRSLVRRAFEAGALGYLSKACPPDCLVDAVRSLQAGRRCLSPELPAEWLRPDPPGQSDGLAGLSTREFEIFRLLAQGHSASECASALNLSSKTVSNHQTTIKEKLGVATSAALAHLAIRHGVIGASGLAATAGRRPGCDTPG
jgi:DNA-binding NarL/FixJ family response regulator